MLCFWFTFDPPSWVVTNQAKLDVLREALLCDRRNLVWIFPGSGDLECEEWGPWCWMSSSQCSVRKILTVWREASLLADAGLNDLEPGAGPIKWILTRREKLLTFFKMSILLSFRRHSQISADFTRNQTKLARGCWSEVLACLWSTELEYRIFGLDVGGW